MRSKLADDTDRVRPLDIFQHSLRVDEVEAFVKKAICLLWEDFSTLCESMRSKLDTREAGEGRTEFQHSLRVDEVEARRRKYCSTVCRNFSTLCESMRSKPRAPR